MQKPAPHKMMTCPYNMAHQVEHYRMETHLHKCRKQYPNTKTVRCPFDSRHVVGDVELDYHVSSCPKRELLDSQLYVMDNDFRPVVNVQQQPNVACEEDWEDTNTTTYIPDPTKKGAHVITKIKDATPSERRKARMEAITKYRPLEKNAEK